MMKKLWKLHLEWDETIPQDLQQEWLIYRQSLEYLNQLEIPRNVINKGKEIEIYGCCVASEIVYVACI